MLPLFDLHCDTFSELYKTGQQINNNSLHISLEKLKNFSPYIQICAIWSDYRYSNDEAYKKCLDSIKYMRKQDIGFSTNLSKLNKYNFILGIEDARLLNYDLSRLDTLYSLGVRVLTLNWKDNGCIGGSWNTSLPLTAFGKNVIKRASELGIIIDLSHSSSSVFEEVIGLAKIFSFSPIASHSNSFAICNHKRNLTDEQFKQLCELKSIVGISFVPEHLSKDASIYDILKHAYHFLSLGGENTICLGSDFDGVSTLPSGITSVKDLSTLYSILKKELGSKITNKIFFENAYSFFQRNL